MGKNFYGLAIILLISFTAHAEIEIESATRSNLTATNLPPHAQRILPPSVPAEVNQTFEKIIAVGNGKVRQGETEVLLWTGTPYKKANAQKIIFSLSDTLKIGGWKYEVGGEQDNVTLFSVLKESGQRRTLIGFYCVTDEALMFAWTEVHENSAGTLAAREPQNNQPVQNIRANNTAGGTPRELIGVWDNGSVSMLLRKDQITGAVTPGRSSYFSYSFAANGTFQFTGLMQTTNYSCTTTLFNEKAGRVRFNGTTVTFIPTKNYWKSTSCIASQNSEKNHTLSEETYQWRVKTDEYNKRLICLANDKGETCYRLKEK